MATVAKSTRSTSIKIVGSPSAGPFSLGFRLFDDDAIDVFVDGLRSTDWVLSATYADGYDDAATITFNTAVGPGTVIIESNLTPGRAADYEGSDPGLVAKMNIELARLTVMAADLHRGVSRSLRGFDALDPVEGIDLNTIALAETYAIDAGLAQVAAEAARDLAIAAQENLFDAWNSAWLTAMAYVQGDLVRENGSTYICLEDHTSGTFATDLGAGKWEIFAQQGAAGAGTGDMLAANNLSDVASLLTALGNLQGAYSQTSDLASTDLDTVTGVRPFSFYKIGTGNSNGWPSMAAGDLLIHFNYSASSAIQIGIRRGLSPGLYLRRKSSSIWDAWYAQASQDYVDAAVASVGGSFEEGPFATTSGTAVDHTGLSGADWIDIFLDAVSISGTDNLLLQLRSGGAPVTTGYVSKANTEGSGGHAYLTASNGFLIISQNASYAHHGVLKLRRVPSSDKWKMDYLGVRDGTNLLTKSVGFINLGAALDGVRLTINGSDTFDAGSYAIRWG